MAEYDRAIASALRVIKRKGQLVTWQTYSNAIPDVTKPWLPTGSNSTSYPVNIAFLPIDKDGREYLASIGKTEAVSGSFYGLMGATNFEPKLTHTVLRGSVKLEISSIDTLSPNGQIILHTIIFKG